MARQKSTIGFNPLATIPTPAAMETVQPDETIDRGVAPPDDAGTPDIAAAPTDPTPVDTVAMATPFVIAETRDAAGAETPLQPETETGAAPTATTATPLPAAPPAGPEAADGHGVPEPHIAETPGAETPVASETVIDPTPAEAMAEPDDFSPSDMEPEEIVAAIVTGPSDAAIARRRTGARIVRRFVAYSAAAGLLPLPAVDMAGAAAVQVKMLHTLALLYGVPFNAALARQLIMALFGGGGSVMLALPAASAARFVPVVGTAASMVLSPAFASLSCYAVGRAFLGHFEAGGTLETFDVGEIQAIAEHEAKGVANIP
jgi:uncharacterized protein (DUF697 family)